jgi:hypothetical protein
MTASLHPWKNAAEPRIIYIKKIHASLQNSISIYHLIVNLRPSVLLPLQMSYWYTGRLNFKAPYQKMSKVSAHRKNTKAGIDIDEARRKREDNIIELRKSKRDENLQKKRSTFATPQYASEDSTKGSAGQKVG